VTEPKLQGLHNNQTHLQATALRRMANNDQGFDEANVTPNRHFRNFWILVYGIRKHA
jgi:hypothetical protein